MKASKFLAQYLLCPYFISTEKWYKTDYIFKRLKKAINRRDSEIVRATINAILKSN